MFFMFIALEGFYPLELRTFLGVLANFNLWGEREHPRNYP